MPFLPRAHLFEFNDRDWVPESLRDTIVETLSRSLDWGGFLRPLTPVIESFLTASGTRTGPTHIEVGFFLKHHVDEQVVVDVIVVGWPHVLKEPVVSSELSPDYSSHGPPDVFAHLITRHDRGGSGREFSRC